MSGIANLARLLEHFACDVLAGPILARLRSLPGRCNCGVSQSERL